MVRLKKKVAVAFSGGKDSTAAILLLRKQNYLTHAFTMRFGFQGEDEKLKRIEYLAEELAISWKIIDLRDIFQEKIIQYFVHSYADGYTPNPCSICNREIKFKVLFDQALKYSGCDYFASGHYADLLNHNGTYYLKEPKDRSTYPIYFMSLIGKERMDRVIFPLANYTVDEVRSMVRHLPLGNKRESQDVCFLENQSLFSFLQQKIPEKFQTGNILDINGQVIGQHKGSIYFTIGQRRGTKFSSKHKLYVIKTDVKNNTITLGEDKDLFSDLVSIAQPVFWKQIKPGERYPLKIRYMTPASPAEIIEVKDDYILAKFKQPVRAITPGQIGAFYQNDTIIAAGTIK